MTEPVDCLYLLSSLLVEHQLELPISGNYGWRTNTRFNKVILIWLMDCLSRLALLACSARILLHLLSVLLSNHDLIYRTRT